MLFYFESFWSILHLDATKAQWYKIPTFVSLVVKTLKRKKGYNLILYKCQMVQMNTGHQNGAKRQLNITCKKIIVIV